MKTLLTETGYDFDDRSDLYVKFNAFIKDFVIAGLKFYFYYLLIVPFITVQCFKMVRGIVRSIKNNPAPWKRRLKITFGVVTVLVGIGFAQTHLGNLFWIILAVSGLLHITFHTSEDIKKQVREELEEE